MRRLPVQVLRRWIISSVTARRYNPVGVGSKLPYGLKELLVLHWKYGKIVRSLLAHEPFITIKVNSDIFKSN